MNETVYRICPICCSIGAARVCRNHGKNWGTPMLTLAQLRARVGRYQASAKLLHKAIRALEEWEGVRG